MSRSAPLALLLAPALLLAACGGEDGGPAGPGPAVAGITVSPSNATLTAIEDTRQLSASALDQNGQVISGVTFTWSSSDDDVATVDAAGLVTARGGGSATISAAASGRTGSATVTVDQVAAGVEVSPAEANFQGPGEQIQFEATAEDANGHPIPDQGFVWSSTAADVVSVDGQGLATAQAPGRATVRASVASAEGVVGEALASVGSPDGPMILAIVPDPLVEGAPATLTGENFSSDPPSNLVLVDGVEAEVTAASATELQILVPGFECLPTRTVNVRVEVAGVTSLPHPSELGAAEGPVAVAPGELLLLEDPEAFCLRFEESPASESYLVGVQSTSDVVASLTGVRVTSVTSAGQGGGALLSLAPARRDLSGGRARLPEPSPRWKAHREAEASLRLWEREAFLAPGTRGLFLETGRQGVQAAAVPSVGDIVQLRVPDGAATNLCAEFIEVSGIVRAVGSRGIWLEDPGNPSGGFSASDFQALSDEFDGAIYEKNEQYFGTPTDLDGNDRILILVSKEVNLGSPALGFVFTGDFFPRSSCPSSDEGEIFYARAPDPVGDFGPPYATALARLDYPFVIAHELAHVIQVGRRVEAAAPFMEVWLMEGQATLAEEVVGHAVTGRSAGQNYGFQVAFNSEGTDEIDWYRNGFTDLARYYGFLSQTTRVDGAPEECGWLMSDPSPCVSRPLWYGVTWSFLRWASDQFGPSHAGGEAGLHRELVDSGLSGFANVAAATGESGERMLAEWAATLYADGRLAGGDPRLAMSSWDLLDIFESLVETARLAPLVTGFTDFQAQGSVRAGSTAYLLMEGSGRPESAVRVRDAADHTLPSAMQVWVVRLQ